MLFAAEKVLNKKPEYIVSYSPFYSNDSIYLDYAKDVNYIQLDKAHNLSNTEVDIVVALCPCAGLSQLNSAKSRGTNAPQNDWMYESTEKVLAVIHPRVLIGENAPALYDGVHGVGVLERLKEIGKKYNYSMSVVKTNSILHGIPQNRKRSFYFFWKNETCPILSFSKSEDVSLIDYLNSSNINIQNKEELSLTNYPEYNFIKSKYGNEWRSLDIKSLSYFMVDNNLLDEYIY
jgi:site-specific DNA-cytosine methylase